MMRPSLLRNVWLSAALLCSTPAAALEVDARLKWFTTGSALPEHDIQRVLDDDTSQIDHNLDLRVMMRQDVGPVRLLLDHSTIILNGDSAAVGLSSAVDQTVGEDARRWVDMTWELDEGSRHRAFHRLDRLALQYQGSRWGVTLGRQAVSWGSGLVFQPMDIFSPFSPTVVDRDYKAGDDLILIDHLLPNGHDLQFLHILRRNEKSHVTADVSSTALKWHGYAGAVELEAVAAEHYDQPVYAASVRFPVGQALVRTDVVASRALDKDWVFTGILNADYTFLIAERTAYVFGEYFFNGWGVDDLPASPALLPLDLTQRLSRGELFNLNKHYAAVGMSYEWHPLINHSLTVIGNLSDSSLLAQMQLSYTPGDSQSLQFGWLEPLGGQGDEFGGIPVAPGLTTGGASRGYLRWVFYL